MGKYNRTHEHGNSIGGGGGKNKKKRNQGLGGLSDVTSVATGKDLVKLARAMARAEIKPQVRAYRRLIKELKGQQAADTIGLERLGAGVQKDIQGAANAFDTGAQGATARTQAVGGILQSQLAQQGAAAAQEQQTAQTGVLGGLQENMALQGAPQGGAAQAALADLVAQQGARTAAETQASGQFASSQQGSYGGLVEGMRAAGGMQAATARRDASKDIASRIAEMRLQSGQDIREAAGKKADIKATKGDVMLTKLAELRGQERDYDLGRRATATDRRGQTLGAAADAAALAETQRHNQTSEGISQQNADSSAQNADTNAQNADGNGGPPEGQAARRKEAKQIKNAAQDFVDKFGEPSERNHPETAYLKLKQYLLSQEGIGNRVLIDRVLRQLGYTVSSGGNPPHPSAP
jgi:hypothetical protein